MDVTIRLFAADADRVGTREMVLSMPNAASVRQLRAELRHQFPAFPQNPIIAVNAEYAGDDTILTPNDEIAIIPPVAGG